MEAAMEVLSDSDAASDRPDAESHAANTNTATIAAAVILSH